MKAVKGVALGLIVVATGALLLAAVGAQKSSRQDAFKAPAVAKKKLPPPSTAEKNAPLMPYVGSRPAPSRLTEIEDDGSSESSGNKAPHVSEARRLRDPMAGEGASAQASFFYAGSEPLRYNNGYVQHRPHVYVTFWGKGWNNQGTTKEKTLDLYRWLSGSSYASILNQYFDHNGPIGPETDLTSYTDTREDPQKVTAAAIRSEVAYSIEHQGWGTPNYENQYVVIMSPQATFTNSLKGFCGAHSWWGEGWNLSYTIVGWPEAGSACYEAGATQPWQAIQETASHEWAESATDPIPIAPYRGWSNSHWEPCEGKCAESESLIYAYCAEYYCLTNEEVADECGSGEESGYWLNKEYDNYLWAATGAYCVLHDASPVRYAANVEQPVISEANHSAEMRGSVNPAGYNATYQFEFKRPNGEYSIVPASPGALGKGTFSPVPLSGTAALLKGETTYQVTLNSTSELTTGIETGTSPNWGGTLSFTTPNWRPAISVQAPAEIGANFVKLHATIDPQGYETTYYCEWGKTASYGNKETPSPASVGSGTEPVLVEPKISWLSPETTYHYRIVVTNAEGTTYTPDQTFTTVGNPHARVEDPTSIGTTSAVLRGEVNPNGAVTKYHFEYGTEWEPEGLKYKTPEQTLAAGKSYVPVSAEISGLSPFTQYQIYLVSTNIGGSSAASWSFWTLDPPPVAETGAASELSGTSAKLSGTVNPEGLPTKYSFQYGTSIPGMLHSPQGSLPAGTSPVEVNQTLSGLSPSTTYYYRIVATNPAGGWGEYKTFTTTDGKPKITIEAPTAVKAGKAILHAKVNPNGLASDYRFEWGKTTSYGNSIPVPDGEIGSGGADVAASQTIEGLKGETTYHYRVVAENSQATTTSADQTFTTPVWHPTIGYQTPVGVTAGEATLTAGVNPHSLSTS